MLTRRLATALVLAAPFAAPALLRAAVLHGDGTFNLSGEVPGDMAGRRLVLAGIRQPAALGRRWRRFQPQADAALKALLAGGEPVVQVHASDRWGRAVADIEVGGRSLAQALVAGGWALFEGRAGDKNASASAALLAAEGLARAGGAGLWGQGYRVFQAGDAMPEGEFAVVQGRVLDVATVKSNTYFNFGADWHTDFTALADSAARRALRAAGVNPAALKGSTVRMRGMLEVWNGPLVRLASAADIERLDSGKG